MGCGVLVATLPGIEDEGFNVMHLNVKPLDEVAACVQPKRLADKPKVAVCCRSGYSSPVLSPCRHSFIYQLSMLEARAICLLTRN
jgi:hypothetical protein